MAKTITDSDYEALVKNASKPVILEFGADWWPGCRQLRPVVSKVAEESADVDFYYVDVDQSPELPGQFGIRSIPTMVLVKGGEEVKRTVGFIPEEQVKQFAKV